MAIFEKYHLGLSDFVVKKCSPPQKKILFGKSLRPLSNTLTLIITFFCRHVVHHPLAVTVIISVSMLVILRIPQLTAALGFAI